jgi:hypothetical protein
MLSRKNVKIALISAILLPTLGMLTAKLTYQIGSTQIYSQAGLEKAIEQELPHFQTDEDITLIPKYVPTKSLLFEVQGESWKINENTYRISATNQGTVRHELEHIFGGHLEKGNLPEREGLDFVKGYLSYMFYYEPSATFKGLGLF